MSTTLDIISVNLSEIARAQKAGHSSLYKKENGDITVSLRLNKVEPDKYGNTISVQLNSHKDKLEQDKKIELKGKSFVGNGRTFVFDEKKQGNGQKPAEKQVEEPNDGDLPF